MRMRDSLTAAEARRIALAAQGFGRGRPDAPGTRQLNVALARMRVLQIDSVNVFARSHYLPLFSRLGAYDTPALDRLLFTARPAYVESWAHVAAFIPAADWGLFSFRHRDLRRKYGTDDGWEDAHRDVIDWVRSELAARGPLRSAEIEHDAKRARRGPWWDWDIVKLTLERLFMFGEVAIAGRRGFERRYALAEHVIPDAARAEVPRDDAIRELVHHAVRAHGVATASDIADYWRLKDRAAVLSAVRDLVDQGELHPVRVEGWTSAGRPLPAWRHRAAPAPRRVETTAILTPFDPVVWFRDRAERLFDLDYRIEIYTPPAKRRFGYYSLPVLMDDGIVGRVDLKADRASATLRVQSAWWEPPSARRHRPADAAERLAAELRSAAAWQRLDSVSVGRWGDAADEVAAALGPGTPRHERSPSS
jgi:uncharacterized protein YcaQ